MPRYDFANILFGGPCNLRCPYCIGRQLPPALGANNLNEFPLRNLDRFVDLLNRYGVTEVSFTGTTTDPQLYRHEARLLNWLRKRLSPAARFSLHTNGQLALPKINVVNRYNRVSLSFPSFNPDTYEKMTGSRRVPNLAQILQQAKVPVKISCIVTRHNTAELPDFLARCHSLGVRRLVFRQPYGHTRPRPLVDALPRRSTWRGNPVYDYRGMEVTWWDFSQTTGRSLNLFSNGLISPHYLLAQATKSPISSPQLQNTPQPVL